MPQACLLGNNPAELGNTPGVVVTPRFLDTIELAGFKQKRTNAARSNFVNLWKKQALPDCYLVVALVQNPHTKS